MSIQEFFFTEKYDKQIHGPIGSNPTCFTGSRIIRKGNNIHPKNIQFEYPDPFQRNKTTDPTTCPLYNNVTFTPGLPGSTSTETPRELITGSHTHQPLTGTCNNLQHRSIGITSYSTCALLCEKITNLNPKNIQECKCPFHNRHGKAYTVPIVIYMQNKMKNE